MSQVCIGYFEIKKSSIKEKIALALRNIARENGIGIFLNDDVHFEEVLKVARKKTNYVIFSITNTFEYDTCSRIVLPDLCREGEHSTYLKDDLCKIKKLIDCMLEHSNRIQFFLGNWNCFECEYTQHYMNIANFVEFMCYTINNEFEP